MPFRHLLLAACTLSALITSPAAAQTETCPLHLAGVEFHPDSGVICPTVTPVSLTTLHTAEPGTDLSILLDMVIERHLGPSRSPVAAMRPRLRGAVRRSITGLPVTAPKVVRETTIEGDPVANAVQLPILSSMTMGSEVARFRASGSKITEGIAVIREIQPAAEDVNDINTRVVVAPPAPPMPEDVSTPFMEVTAERLMRLSRRFQMQYESVSRQVLETASGVARRLN